MVYAVILNFIKHSFLTRGCLSFSLYDDFRLDNEV